MLIDRRTRAAWPFSKREAGHGIGSVGRACVIALTIVVAVGANARLFQIGDSGAKATWQRVRLAPEPQDPHK
jgi:hypothetical protein